MNAEPRRDPLRRDLFVQSIGRAIQAGHLFRPGEQIVLAVSGGPDSVALLYALAALAPGAGWNLTVAHLDHRLRPDSAADLAYVRRLAHRLNLPFVHQAVDVSRYADTGRLSIEDAARRLRYAFLREAAQQAGATAVATGHQRDDQAETILLHLIRGSGPAGLSGMPARGPLPGAPNDPITLVRPLLGVGRAEIEAFCRRHRLRPRRDPSNASRDLTRNRVRHDVLPLLAEINPRVVEAVVRLGDAVRIDAEYLTSEADRIWTDLAALDEAGVTFRVEAIRELPTALRVRLLQRAAAESGMGLSARQLAAIERCLTASPSGSVSLDSERQFWRSGEWCGIGAPPPIAPVPPAVTLACPGQIEWGAWRVSARPVEAQDGKDWRARDWVAEAEPPGVAEPDRACIDGAALPPALTVRARRPGDRLHLSGMAGSKSLQDYFVDRKVPRPERDRIPLVVAGDHLVWIAGHRVDRCFSARPDSQRLIELRAVRLGAP